MRCRIPVFLVGVALLLWAGLGATDARAQSPETIWAVSGLSSNDEGPYQYRPLAYSSDNRKLYVGEYGCVKVFDAVTGEYIDTFGTGANSAAQTYSVGVSTSGRLVGILRTDPTGEGHLDVWDTTARTLRMSVTHPPGTLESSIDFDQSETECIFAGQGLRRYFIATGQPILVATDGIQSGRFSPDRLSYMAVGNGQMNVWRSSDWQLLRQFPVNGTKFALMNSGAQAVFMANDGSPKWNTYDLATGMLLRSIPNNNEPIQTTMGSSTVPNAFVIFRQLSQSRLLCTVSSVTGSQLNSLKLALRFFRMASSASGGQALVAIEGGNAFPDPSRKSVAKVATATLTVAGFQPSGSTPPSGLVRSGGTNKNLSFSANGDRVFTVENGLTYDGTGSLVNAFKVTDFSVTTGAAIGTYSLGTGLILNGIVRPQGDLAYIRVKGASGQADHSGPGFLRCVNSATGATVWSVPIENPAYQDARIALSPQGDKVALCDMSQSQRLPVFDAETGDLLASVNLNLGLGALKPLFIRFSPNGKKIVWSSLLSSSGDQQNKAGMIDLDAQSQYSFSLVGAPYPQFLQSADFSPSGQQVAIASYSGNSQGLGTNYVAVYNVLDGSLETTIESTFSGTKNTWIKYSPDGQFLLYGTPYTCKIVDLRTSLPAFIYTKGFEGAIQDVQFSPDGEKIVFGMYDGTIRFVYNPLSTRIFRLTSAIPNVTTQLTPFTLLARGGGFDQGSQIRLRKDTADQIALNTIFRNSGALQGSFNLSGTPLGTYDVVVRKSTGEEKTLVNGLQVIGGPGQGQLQVAAFIPTGVREDREFTSYVECTNIGSAPLPAPLMKVSNSSGWAMRLSKDIPFSNNPALALATGSLTSADQLMPGESIRIPVYVMGGGHNTNTTISVVVVDTIDPEVFQHDWEVCRAAVLPNPPVPPAVFDAVWIKFIQLMGSDTGSYITALRNMANVCLRGGEQVYDVKKLMQVALLDASIEMSPIKTLDSSVDAAVPTYGVPLVFARSFSLGPLRANQDTVFGKGWFHNWDYRIEVFGNKYIVYGPSGTERVFQYGRDAVGQLRYMASTGDTGKLTLNQDNTFSLREVDGTKMTFTNNGDVLRLTRVEDANGVGVSLTWVPSSNRLAHLTHTSGDSLDLAYRVDGRLDTVSTSTGLVTHYTYDNEGAASPFLEAVQYPDGIFSSYDYTSGTGVNLIRTHDGHSGTNQTFSYDGLGRVTQVTSSSDDNPLVQLTTLLEYPGVGQVDVLDPQNHRSSLYFNSAGIVGRVVNAQGEVTQAKFDTSYNLVGSTMPRGQQYGLGYDTKNNAVVGNDPQGGTTQTAFTTDFNRLAFLKDAKGNIMDYTYDAKGNPNRITYADGSYNQYSVNANGLPTSWRNRRGQVLGIQNNARGQVEQVTLPNGRILSYTYDGRGNMLSATDSVTGSVTMTYDADDRLTSKVTPNWSIAYSYDLRGRLSQKTDTAGVTNYQYDELGRLGLVERVGSLTVVYGYDSRGFLGSELRSNGTRTTYTYDAVGRPDVITHFGPGNVLVAQYDVDRDLDGNPIKLTTPAGVYLYTYDALGQMTSVRLPDGSLSTVNYDLVGNRTSVVDSSGTTTYVTNGLNEYTLVGGQALSYDADGNLTHEPTASGSSDMGYDPLNRLVSVTSGSDTWTCDYNALGERVLVNDRGIVKRYAFDSGTTMAELDAGGTPVRTYLAGLGIVGQVEANGNAYVYGFDMIGSTRVVSAPDGSTANTYEYLPFGGLYASSESVPISMRFVGRQGVVQDSTGYINMRARLLSPALGRFLTNDPIGISGGDENLYRYVGNSPLKYVDPSGLKIPEFPDKVTPDPRANGCGPKPDGYITGFQNLAVPDYVPGAFGIYDVSAACNTHDVCYTLAFSHQDAIACDKNLVTDMARINRFDPGLRVDALAYGLAVSLGGHGSGANHEGALFGREPLPSGWAPDAQYEISYGGSGREVATGEVATGNAQDPNEKRGPTGVVVNTVNYLTESGDMRYEILFENIGNAHANRIEVEDDLSNAFDLSTMRLGDIQFGNQTVAELGGLERGSIRVALLAPSNPTLPLNPDNSDLVADLSVTYDENSGKLKWVLQAIDPETNEPPTELNRGLLAPNRNGSGNVYGDGRGEGKLTFTVKPIRASDGKIVNNGAKITFDSNAPIVTNTWSNTFDLIAPSSSVTADAPYLAGPIPLTWAGDDHGGSGVTSYTIYVSVNNGPYAPWLTDTTDTSGTYNGVLGSTYRFYSRAKDGVGHIEDAPSQADATVAVFQSTVFLPRYMTPGAAVTVDGVLEHAQLPDRQYLELTPNAFGNGVDNGIKFEFEMGDANVTGVQIAFASDSTVLNGLCAIEIFDRSNSTWKTVSPSIYPSKTMAVPLPSSGNMADYVRSSDKVIEIRLKPGVRSAKGRIRLDAVQLITN